MRRPLLGMVLLSGMIPALAAEPCPWQGPENSAACGRWDAIMERLEAATEQAQAAASRLESITAGATAAAEIPESEKARARAIIDRLLGNYAPPLPESSGFEIDQNYTLIREEAAYTAQVPKAAWVTNTSRLDFGPLSIRIHPRAEGLASVSFTLGDLITLRQNGKPVMRILLGEQDNQAVWDDALQDFALLTWRLGQLNAVLTDTPASLSLNSASLNQALNRSADATWTERQTLELADITLQLPENTLTIERVVGQFGLGGRDYTKWLGLRNALSATARPSDAEATRRFLAYLEDVNALYSRFDSSLSASNLTLSQTQGPPTAIKRMTLGSGFEENGEAGSTLKFQIELVDLQTQLTGIPGALSPTSARLEIGLSKLPARLLSQIMRISLESERLAEDKQEAYLDEAFARLFLNSRLELAVKDSHISSPDTRFEFETRSAINPEAALGVSGEFNVRIEGLDKALERSAELIDKDTAGPLLALLAALSNRTQAEGKVIDRFAVKLTKEGKVWLNGKDVTTLFVPPAEDPG